MDRQRLIFRGRVIVDNDTLAAVNIVEGSVVHLVVRPEEQSSADSTTAGNTTTSSQTRTNANTSGTTPSFLSGLPGAANILFHSMEVSPDSTPETLARQVTESLMGAFTSFINGGSTTSGNDHATSVPQSFSFPLPGVPLSRPAPNTNASSASAPSSQTRSNRTPMAAAIGRITSRPSFSQAPTSPANRSNDVSHQLVRSNYSRAMYNLNQDLSRLALSPEPSSPRSTNQDVALLESNFMAFSHIFAAMSAACADMGRILGGSEGDAGRLPWDRLHNYLSILHDLPLLMIVQRRLLTTIRANADGGVELPHHLDVPSFLDRAINLTGDSPVTGNTTSIADSMNIEPPE